MALSVQTQISGDVFIVHCNGRIVYGDECAVLRERVMSMLSESPKIVVSLAGVDHIDSEGLGMLVGLPRLGEKPSWRTYAGLSRYARQGSASTHKSGRSIQGVREERRGRRSLRQTGSLRE
jgi:hypothetical protein